MSTQSFSSYFSERDINQRLSKKFERSGVFVLSELRYRSCELDIVVFDPSTLKIATFEIKKANWKRVYQQAQRAKLFSHYSSAVLPFSIKEKVSIDAFKEAGIGLFFYKAFEKQIRLEKVLTPELTDSTNRHFRQTVYKSFYDRYGEKIYDRRI